MAYDPEREATLAAIVKDHLQRVPRGTHELGPATTAAEAAIGSAARKAYEAGVRATEAQYGIKQASGEPTVKNEDEKNDDQGGTDD